LKKLLFPIVAAIVCSALIISSSSTGAAQSSNQSKDARAAVNKFFSLLKSRSYPALYDFLPNDLQKQIDKDKKIGEALVIKETAELSIVNKLPLPNAVQAAEAKRIQAEQKAVNERIKQETAPKVERTFTAFGDLTGDITNFSTEFRFATSAHISGVIRLIDPEGRILVERRLSERQTAGVGADAPTSEAALQNTLNRALAAFVSKVVTDPELISFLTRP